MKISLAQQIDEIDREIDLRKGVYERQIAAGKMRKSVAEVSHGPYQSGQAHARMA